MEKYSTKLYDVNVMLVEGGMYSQSIRSCKMCQTCRSGCKSNFKKNSLEKISEKEITEMFKELF
jgi:hypothetical protein